MLVLRRGTVGEESLEGRLQPETRPEAARQAASAKTSVTIPGRHPGTTTTEETRTTTRRGSRPPRGAAAGANTTNRLSSATTT